MPNSLSKIFTLILAVLLLYYVPTYQSFHKQDDIVSQNVKQATTNFVDNVRMKGYITPQMYEDFQRELSVGTKYLFKTEIKHEQKVYTPVYTNANVFTGEYTVDYDEYYWSQIEKLLFDESSSIPKEDRMYKLQQGDFFSVHVENVTKSYSSMMYDFLTGGVGGDDIFISYPYGGMVLNEDY
ncbi:hypothetical protein MHH81_21070 [Psychrobacillus sp. FSL H8-0484]|uniref:hypothetical protein n=1 Tax=Psychrobacillus sp. FSL H8-0484 TaxID=2921390 RepID=UPI0030FCC45D